MISEQDKMKKISKLFVNKKFTELEMTIEKFGNLDDQSNLILNFFSISKLLNTNSKREDYFLAAKFLEKIYSSDTKQKINLNNLIIASIGANNFSYVERYLHDEYSKDPNNPNVLEGLSKMAYSKSNIEEASKYFGEYATVMKTNFKIWSSYLSIASLNGFLSQDKYLEICKKIDEISLVKSEVPVKKIKEDKIKIGFISGDFATHSVSFF